MTFIAKSLHERVKTARKFLSSFQFLNVLTVNHHYHNWRKICPENVVTHFKDNKIERSLVTSLNNYMN